MTARAETLTLLAAAVILLMACQLTAGAATADQDGEVLLERGNDIIVKREATNKGKLTKTIRHKKK